MQRGLRIAQIQLLTQNFSARYILLSMAPTSANKVNEARPPRGQLSLKVCICRSLRVDASKASASIIVGMESLSATHRVGYRCLLRLSRSSTAPRAGHSCRRHNTQHHQHKISPLNQWKHLQGLSENSMSPSPSQTALPPSTSLSQLRNNTRKHMGSNCLLSANNQAVKALRNVRCQGIKTSRRQSYHICY